MKVFISHVFADRKEADKLAKSLRSSGFNVTFPNDESLPGDNISLKIGQALESSQAMIALLSRNSSKSPWIKKEIEYAVSSPRFRGRLIPVMLQKTEAYPWILRQMNVLPFNVGKIVDRLQNRTASKLSKPSVRHPLTSAA